MLFYSDIVILKSEIEKSSKLFENIECIELNACVLVKKTGRIFEHLAENCPKLRYFAVNRCRTTSDLSRSLFSQHYAALTHFKYIPMPNDANNRVDELQMFLEMHQNVKYLDIECNFLWANRDSINQTNIQLDRLTINIIDSLDNHFPIDEFLNFLTRLHERNFFKSLGFSVDCGVERVPKKISTIPALHALHCYSISLINVSCLTELKELNIDAFADEFNLMILAKNLTKLEHLSFSSANIGSISLFICQSKRLKTLKICQRPSNDTDLVPEIRRRCDRSFNLFAIYLAAKWNPKCLNLSHIKIVRWIS